MASAVPETDPFQTMNQQASGLPGANPAPGQGYSSTSAPSGVGGSTGTINSRGYDPQRPMLGPTLADMDPKAYAANQNAAAWTSFYGALNAPTMGALDKNNADLQARLGMVAGKYGAASGAARAGFDADNKLLDNQAAQNQVDLDAANRQPSLLDALALLTGYKYAGNRDLVEKQKGFAGTTKDLANKGASLDYNQRIADLAKQSRLNDDDNAARGSAGSTGYAADVADFGQQRGFAGQNRDLAGERSQLGYDSSMADLNNQGNQLDLNQEMYRNTSNEDKAKAQDRIKTLGLVADSFGIKKEQLQAALSRTIAENGLGEFASANQILDMMSSNDVQQKQLAANVINQAMNAQGSGITPAQLGFGSSATGKK